LGLGSGDVPGGEKGPQRKEIGVQPGKPEFGGVSNARCLLLPLCVPTARRRGPLGALVQGGVPAEGRSSPKDGM